jgi:putative ABC transport system permease protein
MEILLQHIRDAFRTLTKTPGFTAVAVLTLALGIGANTAIFSVVNAVLLQPLSYPNPDRLVELVWTSADGNNDIASIPKFNVWRQQTQVFDSVAAYDFAGPGINLTGGDRPEQVKGIRVSADYFRVFGAPMAIGRTFTSEEDRPGGPAVAVISNGLWQSRFGGDPRIIDRTIDLGGEAYVVVGVLGQSFSSDPKSDVWLPLRPDANSVDQGHYLRATARLKPDITIPQANAAMKLAAEQFKEKFPKALSGPKDSFSVVPLRDSMIGDVRFGLLLLFGAVALVLLIACVNVANLLLARATIRQREMAIRSAMGASRSRLAWQLLTESLLLSLCGATLGIGVGYLGVRALLAINPGDIPRIGQNGEAVSLDWRVLLFTFLVAVLTGVVFGLAPALTAFRSDIIATLRESGSRVSGGARHNKTRSILVVTEMALALILLVGAVLLIRTFGALRDVNPGFDAHNILTMEMSLAGPHFEKAAAVDQLERDGRRRLESLPGVVSATLTCCLPLEGGYSLPFAIEGQAPKNDEEAQWVSVSSHYFDVFRIPVNEGRPFTERDNGAGSRVVIVNEEFAKKFFGRGDGLGTRVTMGKGIGPEFEEPPREIVGIVGDVREGLDQPPNPVMYVPIAEVNDRVIALNNRIGAIEWVIRTKLQPFSLSADIQRELREASGGLPVAHIRSMAQVVGESTARNDFNMTLLTIFAGVALVLAAIGIYGLMAYSVQQRTQEIGVRMALGANPNQVRRMVVFQGMQLNFFGLILGVICSLALTRLMKSMLFGVKPWDPVTIIVVVVLLSFVTLLAAYLPARRASRVDPIVALRYE